ncbi:MAG TPA: hypothetical protein VGD88_00610 [Opitutaceae bacterium]
MPRFDHHGLAYVFFILYPTYLVSTRSITIRHLTLGSLFKVYFIGGFGFAVLMTALFAAFLYFAPNRVQMAPGTSLADAWDSLWVMLVVWPPVFTFIFGIAAWLAFVLKGLKWATTLEFVDVDSGGGEPGPTRDRVN